MASPPTRESTDATIPSSSAAPWRYTPLIRRQRPIAVPAIIIIIIIITAAAAAVAVVGGSRHRR